MHHYLNLIYILNMELKAIIESCGMKIADVARAWEKETGKKTSIQNIVQICKKGNPNYDTLKSLANILKLSVPELVAQMEEKKYTSIVCPHCGEKIRISVEQEDAGNGTKD